MLKDFELAARRHEAIKEAFVGAALRLAARPAVAAAKWVASNPLKSLGAAMTANEIAQGGKALANKVQKTPVMGPGTFNVSPRTF